MIQHHILPGNITSTSGPFRSVHIGKSETHHPSLRSWHWHYSCQFEPPLQCFGLRNKVLKPKLAMLKFSALRLWRGLRAGEIPSLGDGGQFQSSQQNLMIQNDMPLCAAPLALTDPKVTANSCRTLHSSSFASTVATLVLLLFGVFPKDPYVTPGWC